MKVYAKKYFLNNLIDKKTSKQENSNYINLYSTYLTHIKKIKF